MPVTAIINLRALKEGDTPRSFHALFHPVLLGRISMADAKVGQALHDAGGLISFSLSPVIGRMPKNKIIENESYWVRVCLLEPIVEEVFMESLERGFWNEPVNLGELSFVVEDVLLGKAADHPWGGRESYEELLFHGGSPARISLKLESPTAFKRGDLHYPLPEPSLLFYNLTRRWNLFAPFKLPEKPDCSSVSFAFADLRTKPFPLRNGGTVIGSIGRLGFIFAGPNHERHFFSALLRFAFYSGIGVKTGQGMGMCRVLAK